MITLQFKICYGSLEWRCKDKGFHRLYDKPAIKRFYVNGKVASVKYLEYDIIHRTGERPAVLHFHSNGQVRVRAYYYGGLLHKKNGKPAYQSWYASGQKCSEEYCENGTV